MIIKSHATISKVADAVGFPSSKTIFRTAASSCDVLVELLTDKAQSFISFRQVYLHRWGDQRGGRYRKRFPKTGLESINPLAYVRFVLQGGGSPNK